MTQKASERYQQVGLDRLIRLEWLEEAADLVLAGNDPVKIKNALQERLRDQFPASNESVRGSLEKTITILMRVWVKTPREMDAFRADGLRLLEELPREEHLAIHWGMITAAYPFWAAVAASVGRLLRLQGTAAASQVQRRVREQYGERETVSRRVRYLLRAFVQWGVLKETPEKGIYSQGLCRPVGDLRLAGWLVEAFLRSQPNGSSALSTILDATSLFPFRLPRISGDRLTGLPGRIEVIRHGLDQDLVRLRSQVKQESFQIKLTVDGAPQKTGR